MKHLHIPFQLCNDEGIKRSPPCHNSIGLVGFMWLCLVRQSYEDEFMGICRTKESSSSYHICRFIGLKVDHDALLGSKYGIFRPLKLRSSSREPLSRSFHFASKEYGATSGSRPSHILLPIVVLISLSCTDTSDFCTDSSRAKWRITGSVWTMMVPATSAWYQTILRP